MTNKKIYSVLLASVMLLGMGPSCNDSSPPVSGGLFGGNESTVLSGKIEYSSDDDDANISIVLGPESKIEIRSFVFSEGGGKGYEYETTFRVEEFSITDEGFDSKIMVKIGRVDVEIAISRIGHRAYTVTGLDGIVDQLLAIDNSEALDLLEPYIPDQAMNFTGSISASE